MSISTMISFGIMSVHLCSILFQMTDYHVELGRPCLARLVATSVQHGIASDGAAGYFPLTFRDDLGITGTVNKLNGAVQEWALKEVDHLLHVADRCTTIDELENRMRDRQMQFSTRVLTRRAISESPKIRSVYDFSFPGNIVLAMFEKSFYSLLPDVHFMEHHANPLLAGPVRQAQFSSQGLVPFWFDISKMDKNVHFCVIVRSVLTILTFPIIIKFIYLYPRQVTTPKRLSNVTAQTCALDREAEKNATVTGKGPHPNYNAQIYPVPLEARETTIFQPNSHLNSPR